MPRIANGNTLESFAAGGSVLHGMDPRAKLAAAVVWAVTLAVLNDLTIVLFGCVFGFALLAAARLPVRLLLRRMLAVNLFCGFLWLFLPWSTPGQTMAQWGPITLTYEGVWLALRLTLRCNAIVAAMIALLGTSRLVDVARAMQAWRVPDKLVLMIYFCVRYIDTIGGEQQRLSHAMRLRGFQPDVSIRTYQTYGNLIGLLFIRSRDRAERVYEAMSCRGFTGRLHTLSHTRIAVRDGVFAGLLIGLAAAMAVIEWL